MKRIALFILFFCPLSVFAWDLTMGGGVDYSSYSTNNKRYVGSVFNPEMLPLYFAEFKDDFAIAYRYNIGLGFDTIWRNMFEGGVSYRFGHINLGMGFFVGESDLTFNAIDFGISGHAGFVLEGILFADGGFAASMDNNAMADRTLYSASAGFWLPHILITGEFELRSYTEQITILQNLYSERMLARLNTEIFAKNVPYRLRIIAGWEALSRRIEGSTVLEDVSAHMFFAGLRFFNQAGKTFAWFIKGEVLVNLDDILGSAAVSDLKIYYRASMGLVFSYPER
ncbi:MAG: hypothetical protein LBF80_03325 [Spirochaetaceae bacterium]|jgi:hypothetical protein|nr:hypothetical protein [Spirochaetaceae bacterium]